MSPDVLNWKLYRPTGVAFIALPEVSNDRTGPDLHRAARWLSHLQSQTAMASAGNYRLLEGCVLPG